jgi:shikimate kinase
MANPNLVFMGVCGCGKSTVAELHAQRTREYRDERRGGGS